MSGEDDGAELYKRYPIDPRRASRHYQALAQQQLGSTAVNDARRRLGVPEVDPVAHAAITDYKSSGFSSANRMLRSGQHSHSVFMSLLMDDFAKLIQERGRQLRALDAWSIKHELMRTLVERVNRCGWDRHGSSSRIFSLHVWMDCR